MGGFFRSFLPILQKYKFEAVFISLAAIISLISIVIFVKQNEPPKKEEIVFQNNSENDKSQPKKITVDIEGSIEKPGVYKVSSGTRLNEIVKLAGGLSKQADQNFFARNFNQSQLVSDQEKIYIPSKLEITQGLFSENQKVLNSLTSSSQTNTSQANLVDINSASPDQLDSLPGIGPVTASKIIDSRPYSTIDDLLNKKVVSNSVFEKIKSLITAE